MDWETLYCPNRACQSYGMSFDQGRLVKNGSTGVQKQALCRACGRSVALTYATAYFELDAAPDIFETAIRALAEGNSLRATARIVQIDKDTACDWLDRAAHHCCQWRDRIPGSCRFRSEADHDRPQEVESEAFEVVRPLKDRYVLA